MGAVVLGPQCPGCKKYCTEVPTLPVEQEALVYLTQLRWPAHGRSQTFAVIAKGQQIASWAARCFFKDARSYYPRYGMLSLCTTRSLLRLWYKKHCHLEYSQC